MGLDIRLPIGLLFFFLGALLAVFGLTTINSDLYDERSLGININLIWGLVMVVFGVLMTWAGWRRRAAEPAGRPENGPELRRH